MKNRLDRLAQHDNVLGAILFIIVFGVYQITMCPTVSFTDSGELATVATTLGIAHPTGYPLWTLIGRLAVMIPLATREIIRLNELAGLLTALAVGFFFKLILIFYRSQKVFRFKRTDSSETRQWIPVFSAFVTASTLGFSSTMWAQSVEIEVYALHALLVMLTMIFFVAGIDQQLSEPGQISRRLLLFSFVLGLSFTNHMTTVLLAPGFLYLFFASFGFNKRSWQLIALFVPFFLLGLSVYLYLPIRSAAGPLLDWGHPATLERFWWHVTAKQYQTWMFAGSAVIWKQTGYFVTNFPTEFGWFVIPFLLVGFIETAVRSKRLLLFLVLLFVACLGYTVNFDIHEIDPYFILAYLACASFLAIAVKVLLEWSSERKTWVYTVLLVLIFVALPVIQVINNRDDVDQSQNYESVDFVQNVFSQLEPNAVVFSSLWDYFISPSYYDQLVRGIRPDVTIVDEELLQNRTWYFIQLERNHLGLLDNSKVEVDAFLAELKKFENGEPFEFETIKSRWNDLLEGMVATLLTRHPVYVDVRIANAFPGNFQRVPQGLLVRLTAKGQDAEWKPIRKRLVGGTFSDYVTSDLKLYYATMYTYHSYWLLTKKRLVEATECLREALRVYPSYAPALNLRAHLVGEE